MFLASERVAAGYPNGNINVYSNGQSRCLMFKAICSLIYKFVTCMQSGLLPVLNYTIQLIRNFLGSAVYNLFALGLGSFVFLKILSSIHSTAPLKHTFWII